MLIAFDARDAHVPMPHGSGIYVRHLLSALREAIRGRGELLVLERGGPGPEVVWEQLTLPRLLRRRGVALVHSPDSFLPLRRRCPGVVTIHDLAFEAIPGEMRFATRWKYRALVSRAARSAERVICPSRFTADDVCARYGVPAERVRVIPEAPALPLQRGDAECSGEQPYLLAVGDLRPKKNLGVLVDAWLRLRRQGLEHRLVLAGADVGGAPSLRAMAGDDPLELPGFVDDVRLDVLIRGADALVVPSVYEGFGLVVLDAMARGCPAVLARAGALPETGGSAAAYFDARDPDDLAAAIAQMVGDRDERARSVRAGLERVREFSWKRTAVATVAVYEELL